MPLFDLSSDPVFLPGLVPPPPLEHHNDALRWSRDTLRWSRDTLRPEVPEGDQTAEYGPTLLSSNNVDHLNTSSRKGYKKMTKLHRHR